MYESIGMKSPGKFIEMINVLEDVRGCGERDWGDRLLNTWFPFGLTKKIPELESGDGCRPL